MVPKDFRDLIKYGNPENINSAEDRILVYVHDVIDAMGSEQRVNGKKVDPGTIASEDPFFVRSNINGKSLTSSGQSKQSNIQAAYFQGNNFEKDWQNSGYSNGEHNFVDKILNGLYQEVNDENMVQRIENGSSAHGYKFKTGIEELSRNLEY